MKLLVTGVITGFERLIFLVDNRMDGISGRAMIAWQQLLLLSLINDL